MTRIRTTDERNFKVFFFEVFSETAFRPIFEVAAMQAHDSVFMHVYKVFVETPQLCETCIADFA